METDGRSLISKTYSVGKLNWRLYNFSHFNFWSYNRRNNSFQFQFAVTIFFKYLVVFSYKVHIICQIFYILFFIKTVRMEKIKNYTGCFQTPCKYWGGWDLLHYQKFQIFRICEDYSTECYQILITCGMIHNTGKSSP